MTMIFQLLLCNKLVRSEENINLFFFLVKRFIYYCFRSLLCVKVNKKMERIFFSYKLVFLLREIFININISFCKNIYIIALIFEHNNVSEIIVPYLFITILLDWLFNMSKQYLWLIIFYLLRNKLIWWNLIKSKESKEYSDKTVYYFAN